MKYPWSDVGEALMRSFAGGEPLENIVEDAMQVAILTIKDATPEFLGRAAAHLHVLGAWFRDGRRVVHLSATAQKVLDDLSLELAEAGNDPLRWRAIPNPGNKWHNVPVMIYAARRSENGKTLAPLVIYVRSVGELFAEEVELGYWRANDVSWQPMRQMVPQRITPRWWARYEMPLRVFLRYGEYSGGLTERLVGEMHAVQIGMLVLGALANEVPLTIHHEVKGKGKSAGHRLHNNIKSYDLDASGLFTWKKRILVDDALLRKRLGEMQEAEDHEVKHHASPILHHVQEHQAIYWVTSPGEEKVLHEKEVKGKVYYAVLRPRRAHARGHGLRAQEARMRVGATDI